MDTQVATEVMYAVRRADGDPMGDFTFYVTSEGDWQPAEDDADAAEETAEYEMVRMDLTVIDRRTFGPHPKPCGEWTGDYHPAREWWAIEIQPDGTDENWPVRDVLLVHKDTEADAWLYIADLPETFYVHPGGTLALIDRRQLTVSHKAVPEYHGLCTTCGWRKADH